MSDVRLIVGLGNPGGDYEYTRHNLGFLVICRLSEKIGFKLGLSSFTNGLTAEGEYKGMALCLLMPLTFMNNSGKAVKRVIEAKEIQLGNMIVVSDDFNLDFLQLRLRSKGSDGGHNGLNSVIASLGSEKFSRLRMGIGLPKDGVPTVDYVLQEFTKAEREDLDDYVNEAVDCCLFWLEEGAARAMEKFNQKR